MKTTAKNDSFARMTEERHEPETDIFCAICGNGIYYGDRVAWDKHGEICHAVCMEEGQEP